MYIINSISTGYYLAMFQLTHDNKLLIGSFKKYRDLLLSQTYANCLQYDRDSIVYSFISLRFCNIQWSDLSI